MSSAGQTEIVRREDGPQALTRYEDFDQGIPVERIVARVEKIRAVQERVMKPEHHFGKVPGTTKDCLFKPGAELLCLTFQLAPKFKTVERWEGDHLECVVTCTLVHIPTGAEVGEGVGSCSTKESKYGYRSAKRKCPKCGSDAALNRSKREPGFYCWAAKGGCGATFGPNDKSITEQQVGRVANPDLADVYNTVRKMACKRALVAAVLIVTCASELFTQDVEDMQGNVPPDDGGGWGGGWDDDPPRNQQQGRGQHSAPARDNGGGARSSGGGKATTSAEATARMLELFGKAVSVDALDELAPELNALKAEQVLSIEDYRKLRDAYSARAKQLKNDSRASA